MKKGIHTIAAMTMLCAVGGGSGRVDVAGGSPRSNARKSFAYCSRCKCRRAVGHRDHVTEAQ